MRIFKKFIEYIKGIMLIKKDRDDLECCCADHILKQSKKKTSKKKGKK